MSDWTKARDEVKAQATSALLSALLGWFRRKLARRKAPAIGRDEAGHIKIITGVIPGSAAVTDRVRRAISGVDKAPRG